VNSGKRPVSLAFLVIGAFASADAGRLGEDGTGAMWVAPELLETLEAALPGCTGNALVTAADLPAQGKVSFVWNPATSELSFDAAARLTSTTSTLTLPEDFEPSASTPLGNCGSR
jgi:hypothetical protein